MKSLTKNKLIRQIHAQTSVPDEDTYETLSAATQQVKSDYKDT